MCYRKIESVVFFGALLMCLGEVSAQDPPANFPDEITSYTATDNCILTPLLKVRVSFVCGGRGIAIFRSERKTVQDSWDIDTRDYSTSYTITDVAYRRGGEQLFVSGIKGDGSSIVEKWDFRIPDGRYYQLFVEPVALLDTPAPISYRNNFGVAGGGTWTSGRGVLASADRSVVYEGTDGPFTRISADPEGRFLLLYDYADKSICQLLLSDPVGQVQALYTAQVHPQLDELQDFEPRDSIIYGRVYVIWRNYPQAGTHDTEVYTLLFDADNDGVFEKIESYGIDAYKLTPYWGGSNWIFLNQ